MEKLVFCGHISIDSKGYSTTCTDLIPPHNNYATDSPPLQIQEMAVISFYDDNDLTCHCIF